MRGHRVHDENCETTARRFWGEGRVKNARVASSRKIRGAVFSLGHAIKGGEFDMRENNVESFVKINFKKKICSLSSSKIFGRNGNVITERG